MGSRHIVVLTGAMVCMLSAPAIPQGSKDWIDIVDPKELRAIYSDKTFKGKGRDGSPFVAHYSADGRGIIIEGNKRTPQTWAIKGKDQVCQTDDRGTDCFTFQRHRKNRNEIIAQHVPRRWIFQVTVEDGIPEF